MSLNCSETDPGIHANEMKNVTRTNFDRDNAKVDLQSDNKDSMNLQTLKQANLKLTPERNDKHNQHQARVQPTPPLISHPDC